jgi:hypothetical protein
MFEAEKFPTSISDLNTSLAKMKAESLTHGFEKRGGE